MTIQPALKNSSVLLSLFVVCMLIIAYGAWKINSDTPQTQQLQESWPEAQAPVIREKLPIFLISAGEANVYTLHIDSQGHKISSLTIRLLAKTEEAAQRLKVALNQTLEKDGWQVILNTSQKAEGESNTAVFELALITLKPMGGVVFSQEIALAEMTLQGDSITLDDAVSTVTTQEGEQFGVELRTQLQ